MNAAARLVRTPAGSLRGVPAGAKGEVTAFRGIPFGTAARFAAPEPAPAWEGVRDATRPGLAAPQPPSRLTPVTGPGGGLPQGEDCLTLNVWTPWAGVRDGVPEVGEGTGSSEGGAVGGAAVRGGPGGQGAGGARGVEGAGPSEGGAGAGGGGLPVMVWLHGGGFSSGSGGEAFYDGGLLAERGRMVVVTVNYRLGAFGYLYLGPDFGPANPGLLDQLAALRWVREAIGAFGGDPERVTLAGQSAGALSVLALLAHPAGRGLFHQAVLESTPAGVPPHSPREAAAHARRLAELLGLSPTEPPPADPAEVAHPAVRRAAEAAGAAGPSAPGSPRAARPAEGEPSGAFTPRAPQPAVPGTPSSSRPADRHPAEVRPGVPRGLLASLRAVAVATLLDAQQALARELSTALSVTPPLQLVAAEGLPADLVRAARPDVPLLVGTAREEARAFFPDKPADVLADVTTRSFTEPSGRLAGQATAAYAYRFDWAPPGSPLGACHCIELPFVFGVGEDEPGDPGEPGGSGGAGREAAWRAAPMLTGASAADLRRLTAEVQSAWASFVHTGSPGWEPYPHVEPFRH